ncbi:MAG: hypothetical protein H0X30_27020 [Anaerolineae bacterium]|nr:hypothetical protein [Anaerolineae bacterium]
MSVSVVDRTTNGWTVAAYPHQAFYIQDMIDAMIGDFYRLANQIVINLSLGEWKYYISIGTEKTGILLPHTVTYGLVLIIKSGEPLNDLISTIKPYCKSLLKYLPD